MTTVNRWVWLLVLPCVFVKTENGCQFKFNGKTKEFKGSERCEKVKYLAATGNLFYSIGELGGRDKDMSEISEDMSNAVVSGANVLSEIK